MRYKSPWRQVEVTGNEVAVEQGKWNRFFSAYFFSCFSGNNLLIRHCPGSEVILISAGQSWFLVFKYRQQRSYQPLQPHTVSPQVGISLSILLLHSQSVPSPTAVLSQRTEPNQPEAEFGGDKAVQRETAHHHIILVYSSIRCIKDHSPVFCRGLPKALIPPTSSRSLQEDIDRSQASSEMGKRQERDPLLPAGNGSQGEIHSLRPPAERMVLCGHTWETDSGGRCCTRSGCHFVMPRQRGCTHTLITACSELPWEAGL